MKKRIISWLLVMALVLTMAPMVTLKAHAVSYTVPYEPANGIFISDARHLFEVDGKQYRKLRVGGDGYCGLATENVIFIDENNKLVTDEALLEKLAYIGLIEACLNAEMGTCFYSHESILQNIEIVEALGNQLIEQTIGGAIWTNLNALIAALQGNVSEWALSYADMIKDFGINTSLYLVTISTLQTCLVDAECAYLTLNQFDAMCTPENDGFNHGQALAYETLLRDYYARLCVCEYYIQCIANEVLGGEANDSVDAMGVLQETWGSVSEDFLDAGLEGLYGEDFIAALSTVTTLQEVSDRLTQSWDTEGQYEKYAEQYAIGQLESETVAVRENNIDAIKRNVCTLLGENIYDVSSGEDAVGGSANGLNENDFATMIEELQEEYPHGKYWSDSNGTVQSGQYKGTSLAGNQKCSNSFSWCDECGTFTLDGVVRAWQCHGYALLIAHKLFGSNANNWTKYTNTDCQIFAGDVIRIDTNGNGINDDASDHTIFVYQVTDTHVYYTDCNATGPCQIRWGAKKSLSELRKQLLYVRHLSGNTLKGNGTAEKENTLTLHYDANGGFIPAINKYETTTGNEILRLRQEPSVNSSKLTTIPDGTILEALETVEAGGYTWIKTTYGGYTGWCAVSHGYAKRLGYYLVDGAVYQHSNSAMYSHTWNYGSGGEYGLMNAATLELQKAGYSFVGWSTSPNGSGTVFDQDNTDLKAEDICPDVANASQTVTLYAIWSPVEHNYTAVVIAPTCTMQGYTTYVCVDCGESYVDDYMSALGHAYEAVVTEPTYTAQGYTTHTCTRCGDSYVDSYTDPLNPETAVHVTIGSVTGKAGDTVEVYLTLENAPELKSLAISNLVYDTEHLTLISGEWLPENAMLSDWNPVTLRGVHAFNENIDLNGDVFKLTFTIHEDAPAGVYEVSCQITAKQRQENGSEQEVLIAVESGGVEVVEYAPGDVDGNTFVTTDDAIYLLYYIMFGEEEYPVNQACDFDGNGFITTDDAIYLLYHIMFGETDYPLH